ncbi:MAG: DNA adenine methylase [Myxococcota bacterium]
MIKYLGSKRTLLKPIVQLVTGAPGVRRAADLFSGTSRVGHALKAAGLFVSANDHNGYAHTLAECYVAADGSTWRAKYDALRRELQTAPAKDGWFTQAYARDSRFFQPTNGARIEGIREAIETLDLPPPLRAIALTSLMEAADRVDSTCGVQMAYVKKWSQRSFNDLELRTPNVLDGPGEAHCADALALAGDLEADLVYLDPPYNQHSYRGNYHIWETLVRWDAPERYGVAQKRIDCKTHKSDFNSKRKHRAAFETLLQRLRAPLIIVSFSNEAFLSREDLEAMLKERGPLAVLEHDFKRYIGAQIGIYNPQGDRVGKAGALRNTERMYLSAGPSASKAQRAYVQARAQQPMGAAQLTLP